MPSIPFAQTVQLPSQALRLSASLLRNASGGIGQSLRVAESTPHVECLFDYSLIYQKKGAFSSGNYRGTNRGLLNSRKQSNGSPISRRS
jgi:hypothetical protein